MTTLRSAFAFAAIAVSLFGCGNKKKSGRDPMKLCQKLEAKGLASGCAEATTPMEPTLASATKLVGFTVTHELGGTGQFAIFADEESAKSAFMMLREARGSVVGDYPTKIVIYWETAGGDSPREGAAAISSAVRDLL